ncbi:RING-H2 finger protein ATL65-like [Silene latifolia]|uniref:RING-H2 finger protein ATL65-like n=1 Tax=Silene latifolia TaxID=37657 RepID=UPI003D78A708
MKTTSTPTPTPTKPTWSDPPEQSPMSSPTPSPITAPATPITTQNHLVSPRQNIDLSPPLLAMVIIAAAAFLLIAYSRFLSQHLFPPLRRILQHYRRWRCRMRHHHHFPPFPSSDTDSLPPLPLPLYDSDAGGGFYVYSPYYGLHDSVINTIPLTTYNSSKLDLFEDCAVCLLDFEDGDYMRTLPHCSHSFHVDCIDVWLRAHATCPICRANDFFPRNSPMIPLMSARIRPSFESVFLAPLPEQLSSEIQPAAATEFLVSPSPTRRGILIQSDDRRRDINLLLKRSYSFSFERRSFASERLSATTPHRRQRRRSFWLKRPSSWRVFPSPAIFRRRSKFPMSESSASWRYGGGRMLGYTSSRMRMGDPEALISPERWRN